MSLNKGAKPRSSIVVSLPFMDSGPWFFVDDLQMANLCSCAGKKGLSLP